jgi:myo-inositol-1(or 4)-monophosphatase
MTQPLLKDICSQTAMLIRETGNFIAAELGKVDNEKIELKSLNSLVSYVDKTAEEMLVRGCAHIMPEAGFITEEETIAASAEKDWRWIIDPLDGTTNFLHQLPFFSISVALQKDGKTVVGLVYEVNRQELFSAYLGGGCQLNGKVVKVSKTAALSDSLLATGFPYYDFEKTAAYLQLLGNLMPKTRGIRRLGSAALDLAYTACGRFDAFFEYSLSPWDVAAGAILVQEAGGLVSDFKGGDDYIFGKEILATNFLLKTEMDILMKIHFKP